MIRNSGNKLIVILGPTASGKSDLAVRLAKSFHGEVISADSRQVYRGLNIGSGKINKKEMKGVPHHLLNVASPKRTFTVVQFQKLAFRAIQDIQRRKHVPFLAGGTGFYIKAVVDNVVFPEVKPNTALRAALGKKSTAELFKMLNALDPSRAKTIDSKNPRRLMRAIEIAKAIGKPVPKTFKHSIECLNVLQIGIKKSPEELKKAIKKRLLKRLRKGMVAEVKKLHKNGLSWKRLEDLGLEYRLIAQYLQNKLSYYETVQELQKEIWRFAKRQITWFKRDKRIHWVKSEKEAALLVKHFLA